MPVRQWAAVAAICLGLLMPNSAHAAGFWNLGRGPSHYGRGAANIAAPQDPIAVFINPSALAGLDGLQLTVDGNLVFEQRQFTRAPDSVGGPRREYETVENEVATRLPSPGIFLSYNFGSLGLEELSLGAGVYGPPRTDREWDPEGPQRYGEIESHNLQIHQALSLAYQLPWYDLRIGVTGMLTNQIIDTTLKLNAPIIESPSQPENSDYDVGVHAEAEENWIPGGIIGISAAPTPWLRLAVSFQLPYDVAATGTAGVELSEFYASEADVEGERLSVNIKMPPILRVAAQYVDPDARFDVELAVVWEGWSRNDAIEFTPEDIVLVTKTSGGRSELGTVTIENDWEDTLSVRLGGAYRVIDDLWLVRAGAYFEQGAVPEARLNVGSFDLDKVGFSLGSRLDLPAGLWIDLAVGVSQWLTRTVEDSEVLLDNPLDPDIIKHSTANGTYENRQIFAMAGVGVALDL